MFIALAAVFTVTASRDCFAKNASIEELIVTNSSSDLLLFLNVKNAFTAEMEEGIRNGIPVTFSFYVELSRNRKAWLNEDVISLELEHTLAYDTLKEEYAVSRSEADGQIIRTKSLPEAKRAMSQLNGVQVLPLNALRAEEEYSLRVKAKLAEKTLPLYFHYVVPFLSLWDFETDWYSLEFRY
ncbi:DUF4390 domain-containing protein [Thiovibrio sp. JS02]